MKSNLLGYSIIGAPSEHLLLTVCKTHGEQLWTLVHMTYKHSQDACAICGSTVGSRAFRPIGNRSNRMHRICTAHIPKPKDAVREPPITVNALVQPPTFSDAEATYIERIAD